VHEQRQHRQDDADGRGQLEFAFEEHLIVSLLPAPSPDERVQGQQFSKKITQAYLRRPNKLQAGTTRLGR
jgi:hypothetical protein